MRSRLEGGVSGMAFAIFLSTRCLSSGNKTVGDTTMNTHELLPLREQAMHALQESTTMLEVACNLMEQGNKKEAERLHKAARTKRNISVLLMAKANAVEAESGDRTPSRYSDMDSETAH